MKSISRIKAILIFALSITFLSVSAQKQKGIGIFDGFGDVGDPKLVGNIKYDASTRTYTITAGGINVWGTFDQFFYAWKNVKGNFSLTAKVSFEGAGVDPHRKIGIMLRETLTAGSRCAHISIHGDGLTSLQYRSQTDGITREIVGPKDGDYIILEKVGKKIRMKTATGTLPHEVTGEIEMEFPKKFFIGIYASSRNVDVLETAYFTNVEFKKL